MKPADVLAIVCVLIVAGPGPARGQDQRAGPPLEGRLVSDVLRDLQARGLNIVFSSELVRPGLRVQAEPVSRDDRGRAAEVLAAHGLALQAGPRGLLLVVRKRREPAGPSPPEPGSVVRGVVVDARSATPLPGVLVRVAAAPGEAVTDADGRFELARIPAGPTALYASLVGYALARPRIDVAAGQTLDLTVVMTDGTGTYSEEVTVTGDRFRGTAPVVPSAMVLNSADLFELRGVLSDDPFRAAQALPSIMTGNDYRSEFSVRGADFDHVGLTVDGVETGWPVHTVRNELSGGSVSLINGDVVDGMTLVSGAYPQDRPARTGGWLDIAIREGSRVRTQAHAAVGMTSASLVLEGPLGDRARGAWIVSARQSYLQWVLARLDPPNGTTFGFSDVQGKAVFDVTPRQQVQATLFLGRSLLEKERQDSVTEFVRRGSADAGLAVFGWRSTPTPAIVVTQQFAAGAHAFENDGATGLVLDHGSGTAFTYRGQVSAALRPRTLLRAGIDARSRSTSQRLTTLLNGPDAAVRLETIDGRQGLGAFHARLSHTTGRGLALDGGVMLTKSSSTTASPWINASVPVGRLVFRAGAGIYRQHPALEQTASSFSTPLRPEWSRHVDLGIEYALRPETRLQLTFYDRRERDTLRFEDSEYRLVGGAVTAPLEPEWRNALDGASRGIEVIFQRRAAAGLTGWIAYGYGQARYDDEVTGERFDGDYDQRHTLAVYGHYRASAVTSVSAKLRAGSNFPIPGYLEPGAVGLTLSSRRNTVRLPAYARLDLRANRAFNFDSRRLTLFVEVVNVLARTNYAADAYQVLADGRVVGTTQRLFPFLPTVGLSIDF